MPRTLLHNRRSSRTHTLTFAGQECVEGQEYPPGEVCAAMIGFDAQAAPREVFLSGSKQGTDIEAFMADAAVVISIALQYGISPHELAKSVGRVPLTISPTEIDIAIGKKPASIIGAVLNLLKEYHDASQA